MITITPDQLKAKLDRHSKWLLGDYESGEKLDLYETDLSGADLRGANLYGADLRRANLSGADLYGADLRRANLCGANLCRANLSEADLCRANLSGADLRDANLYGADLRRANLYGADLSGADLRDANLFGADLEGVTTVFTFTLGRHFGVYQIDTGHCQIGCKHMKLPEWLNNYKQVGESFGYTETEITRYGAILVALSNLSL